MTYLGLIFEIIILVAAVYGYLFTRGKFSSNDPEVRKKAEAFREQNGWWMRIGCLMIIALMSVEIVLHFRDIFA